MRRGFGLIWGLLTVLIAGAAAYFGYAAGWAAGVATKVPEGAAAVAPYGGYPYWGYHGFGFFPFFGFIWFFIGLLILFAVFRAARFGRWRHHGAGGGFEEWHRRQHETGGNPPAPTSG